MNDWTAQWAIAQFYLRIAVIIMLVPIALIGPLFLSLGLFNGLTWLGSTVTRWPVFIYGSLVLRSLRRNLVRSTLTYIAIFLFVAIITMIWSVLSFIDAATAEQSKDVKLIITERFQIPSQMPIKYADQFAEEATAKMAEGKRAKSTDVMSWSFVGTSTDPNKRDNSTIAFFFALKPATLATMMDDLEPERLSEADNKLLRDGIDAMKKNTLGVMIGRERLASLNKKVGERFQGYSFNYKDIVFDFEIVGTFPEGRYNQSAAMNAEYLQRKLDDYKREKKTSHPLADRSLNLFWVRVPDKDAFEQLEKSVTSPGKFSSPSVKVETASAGISTFLDAYKDIFKTARYVVAPAFLVIMSQVVAIAISISVRERRTEMAVLKVLGFGPNQVVLLILGEAVLIGGLSGTLGAWLTLLGVNFNGGLKFPIAFFPIFKINEAALWWGPVLGAGTAFVGSIVPAWSARSVKVSEVFSKIA